MTDEQALEAAQRIIVADAFLSTREDTLTVARALVAQEARARKLETALIQAANNFKALAFVMPDQLALTGEALEFEKDARAALAEGRGK